MGATKVKPPKETWSKSRNCCVVEGVVAEEEDEDEEEGGGGEAAEGYHMWERMVSRQLLPEEGLSGCCWDAKSSIVSPAGSLHVFRPLYADSPSFTGKSGSPNLPKKVFPGQKLDMKPEKAPFFKEDASGSTGGKRVRSVSCF